jgi:hypothetical protein
MGRRHFEKKCKKGGRRRGKTSKITKKGKGKIKKEQKNGKLTGKNVKI